MSRFMHILMNMQKAVYKIELGLQYFFAFLILTVKITIPNRQIGRKKLFNYRFKN